MQAWQVIHLRIQFEQLLEMYVEAAKENVDVENPPDGMTVSQALAQVDKTAENRRRMFEATIRGEE